MDYQIFPVLTTSLSILLFASFIYIRRYANLPGVHVLSLLLLSVLGWMICNTFELITPTEHETLLWARITYVFIAMTPVLWVFFVFDYFGYHQWMKLPNVLLYWIVPLGTIISVFTNDWHHLFWRTTTFLPAGDFLALKVTYGFLFLISWVYAQAMIFTGIIFMLRENFYHIRYYRAQFAWIMTGLAIVIVFNTVHVSNILPEIKKDYTPVALAIASLCFVMAVSRYHFIKVAPVSMDILFDIIDDGLLVLNSDAVIINTSASIWTLLNIPARDAVGKSVSDVFSDYPVFCRNILEAKNGQFELCLREQPPFYLSVKVSPVEDYSKFVRGRMILIRDISKEKMTQLAEHQERIFAEALSKIAAALNSTRNLEELFDLIITYAVQVTACDSAEIMMIEGDYARVVRSSDASMHDICLSITGTENLRWMVKTQQAVLMSDVRNDPGWVSVADTDWIRSYVGAPILASSGSTIGFINLNSVTPGLYDEKIVDRLSAFSSHASIAIQNARTYKKLEDLANLDGLTYLYNRRCFFDMAAREFARAQRHQRALAAIMIDVDQFKTINDSFGHLTGDQVLCQIAGICKEGLRTIDVIGRYGGEEFAVILPDTNLDEAHCVAERLCRQIASAEMETLAGVQRVTVSIGVAALDQTCSELEDLISYSDTAMYQAKENGRNRVEIFSTQK
ncbi:MAG: diguanylate cyclase [Anaerolineae bacterium]|nr:diguanylate cyclase [Anaerolineae bacterium]